MDIYTTSFCLPRSAYSQESTTTKSSNLPTSISFDFNQDSPTSPSTALRDINTTTTTTSSSSSSNNNNNNNNGNNPLLSSSQIPKHRHSTSSLSSISSPKSISASLSNTTLSGTAERVDRGGDRHSIHSHSHSHSHSQSQSQSSPTISSATLQMHSELIESMNQLCSETMANFQCFISVTLVEPSSPQNQSTGGNNGGGGSSSNGGGSNNGIGGDFSSSSSSTLLTPVFNFHISGGYQQVMNARGTILRDNPFQHTSIVKVPRAEVLDSTSNVKLEIRLKLDEIAALTKAHLVIVGTIPISSNSKSSTSSSSNFFNKNGNGNGNNINGSGIANIGFGLETERNVEVVITGMFESVEQGRVRLLVLLDELSGLHSEVCEIDYKLHNIISGRKRSVVQTIQEETGTNIYFPSPLSGVLGSKNPNLLAKQNLIFITGEFFGVQRARDMLFQVSLHKSKCIISRDTAILPRKLDWMLTEKLEEIKSTMNDNGTFINFPPIGSQASLISVYGDHRVNIERTIRVIMELACNFYVSSFYLLPASFEVFIPPPTITSGQIASILKHIVTSSGAEVVFKSSCFELHGLESEVRIAVGLVLELELVKAYHHEIRFQIELANEHREFISGKKNGKLNKISKSANVKIKFETFNDYNFLIDIAGSDTGALYGLSMLQEELPAELSFHVPESYHKRIIGVGGKNIQRIMKKFGVYVKFSNAEEFAALGGYTDNEDNVIARTPAKNSMNLELLKFSVMELVIPKDKDFVIETVSIPRRYHRILLGDKNIFIHDIEVKTNSVVRFPRKETASDLVEIYGPESQIHMAAQMLLDHVPFEAEYRLPHSLEMASLTLSPDFVTLSESIKRDLNITILPTVDRSGGGEETIIRFCLNRSSVDFLSTARDLVQEYLVGRNIKLYPGSLRPRSDSFVENPFPFFNSKLLSAVSTETEGNQEPRSDRSKLRLAASSPNIKALFDANPPSFTSSNNNSNNNHAFRQPDQDFSSFYPASLPQHQSFNSQQSQQSQQQQQQQTTSTNLSPSTTAQSLTSTHSAQSPYGQSQPLPAPSSGYTWGNASSQQAYPKSTYSENRSSLFDDSPSSSSTTPTSTSHTNNATDSDQPTPMYTMKSRGSQEILRRPSRLMGGNRAQSLDISSRYIHSRDSTSSISGNFGNQPDIAQVLANLGLH